MLERILTEAGVEELGNFVSCLLICFQQWN